MCGKRDGLGAEVSPSRAEALEERGGLIAALKRFATQRPDTALNALPHPKGPDTALNAGRDGAVPGVGRGIGGGH
jgi:hypothetical protein